MESNSQSSSQRTLWKDVESGKEKTARYRSYQWGAIILGLLFLTLAICFFALRYFWSPSPGKVYDQPYKAVLDGMETDSVMEIDPAHHVEVFRMGNGSDEVLEVHDFKNGITGIRFAKHQRCYIRTQTKELPKLTELKNEDAEIEVSETGDVDMQVEESQVWIPVEEPIANRAFLLNSKIWEICQNLPIHWIHPSPLRDADFHDVEDVEDPTEIEVKGRRETRDVLDHLPVNDYSEIGLQLDNSLDEQGYCCQYCRRGYRYCRKYHEPLRGFWPYPYWYQGGRVICQIVMPCNWWIARMLGRV
ncbi:tenomodulin [Chanos chanos]|uniref:Tenomodulin n=1 Tax=Chanos chanos TaxID=29144 RepID=A0A6J2UTP6_CHACN|nr:tenomodulin [Chanos chanos]